MIQKCSCENIFPPKTIVFTKQAQNLCIDASVDQFLKELKKFKSFVISGILLKCFKNQNKLRICANFVYGEQPKQKISQKKGERP